MQALTDLQAYGYQAELSAPDKIRLTWTRSDPPDPAKVEPLLAELRARKAEALEALRGTLEIDLATPGGPRSVTVTGNATPTGDRITDAGVYQGKPDRAAVDLADRILDFIVARPGPVPEAEIVTAIGGDSLLVRNVVRRLAVEGIAEALPGGLYGIPPWPPAAPDLPRGCPLDGAPFPGTGCRFHRRLFARLVAEGALPTGGPCPLRRVCEMERGK